MATNNQNGNSDAVDYKNYRNSDGTIKLRNPHIEAMKQDYLYHLALGKGTHDLVEMFQDVKFVCMGGTAHRMKMFAHYLLKELDHKLPTGTALLDLTEDSHRFSMYKVGPVLAVNHGMGVPSLSILLHEVIKLMHHAKVKDPIFFRIGTCGGIDLEPGTVVISDDACDELLRHYIDMPVCGEIERRPTKFDQALVEDLLDLAQPTDPFKTVRGITMCANDFYEGQGRLDGAFCNYNEKKKMEYLQKLKKHGVKNIEMESVVLAALTHRAGIKTADICVTFLDRLKGDQVLSSPETLDAYQLRPQIIVGRYIKQYLQKLGKQ